MDGATVPLVVERVGIEMHVRAIVKQPFQMKVVIAFDIENFDIAITERTQAGDQLLITRGKHLLVADEQTKQIAHDEKLVAMFETSVDEAEQRPVQRIFRAPKMEVAQSDELAHISSRGSRSELLVKKFPASGLFSGRGIAQLDEL